MIDPTTLIRSNIAALIPYASARSEYAGNSDIWLDANEFPTGRFNRYPDPNQTELKQRIATLRNLPTDQIFLGNGSDEAIDLCFRIFCEPEKDRALIFTPTYGMYEVCATIHNTPLVQLPLTTDFQVDLPALERLDKKDLKLMFLCSPNNPTGNVLENLRELIAGFPGIVVLDEAYADFSSDSSMLTELDRFPNLIILQTLSKAYALAGLRIGMAFASKTLISVFNKVKPPYNISTAAQQLALDSLADRTTQEQKIAQLLQQRKVLSKALQTIETVQTVFPSQANFLLVRFRDPELVYKTLLTAGIVVRNRNTVVPGALRISIGTEKENQRLIQILQNLS